MAILENCVYGFKGKLTHRNKEAVVIENSITKTKSVKEFYIYLTLTDIYDMSMEHE